MALASCSRNDLIPLATKCCSDFERENWKQVKVFRKKDDGSYYTSKTDKSRKVYTYNQDLRTGELYNDDSESTVAGKAAGIFLGATFYGIGAMLYNTFRVFMDVIQVAIDVIKNVGEQWKDDKCKALLTLLKGFTVDIIVSIACNLWAIVRPLIFVPPMMITCLYAFINAYDARIAVGKIEKAWHYGVSHTQSCCHSSPKEKEDSLCEQIWKSQVCYLGYCFQPVGNIKDVNIETVP